MRVKHRHKFVFYATCNGGWHGTLSRCECGARRFGGAIGGDDGFIGRAFARPGCAFRVLKVYR